MSRATEPTVYLTPSPSARELLRPLRGSIPLSAPPGRSWRVIICFLIIVTVDSFGCADGSTWSDPVDGGDSDETNRTSIDDTPDANISEDVDRPDTVAAHDVTPDIEGEADTTDPDTDVDGTSSQEQDKPFFYFVLHADPAVGQSLRDRWDNLESFMEDLSDRNDLLPEDGRHHITIMFTANWGMLIQSDRDKQQLIAQWIDDGHEMAFHSHTHNHQFLDGYTNSEQFGPDDPNKCPGDPDLGECSLDYGLGQVQQAMNDANGGVEYDLRFGRIGPTGNGGPEDGSQNDNSCAAVEVAPGEFLADDTGCIDDEWTGDVDTTLNYTTLAYEGGDELTASELHGDSDCVDWADATDIYGIPHAPFETEAGSPTATLATVEEAVNTSVGGEFIGIVIHPLSYVDGPTMAFSGNAQAQINGVFNFMDSITENSHYPLPSRTLSEVWAADEFGSGRGCRDAR